MRRIRQGQTTARRAASAIGAVLGIVALAGPVNAGNGWTQLPTAPIPGGQSAIFDDVASPAAGSTIGVGHTWGTVGGALEFRTLIERWDGATWTRMASIDHESAPATNFLLGVAGTSGQDIWAVGWWSPGSAPTQPLIEHFDGTRWLESPLPMQATSTYLEAVAVRAPDDAWAVGEQNPPGSFYSMPYTLHWDGHSWSPVAFRPAGLPACNTHITLTGVSVLRNEPTAFASGYCESSGGKGFLARYGNGAWRVIAAPVPATSELHGVRARAWNDVWAVGNETTAAGVVSLVLHFDGVQWTKVTVPTRVDDSLDAVYARSATDVWAVGTGASVQPPFAAPIALHYDGTKWTALNPGGFGSFAGVVENGVGHAFAFGGTLGNPFAMRH